MSQEKPLDFRVDETLESDSDEENLIRNVSQLVVRPADHTGRAKKGHLIFDAAFECGNLGRVDRINEFEFDLFVKPDSANPRFRFWFNFTIENVQEGQRIVLNIVNLAKTCLLFFDGFTPVIRSTSNPCWSRLPDDRVFYYRCPYHRLRFVLTICLAFAREEDVYQIALTYPYSYTRLTERLNFYESLTSCKHASIRPDVSSSGSRMNRRSRKSSGRRSPSGRASAASTPFAIFDSPPSLILFTREKLCETLQGRELEYISISASGSDECDDCWMLTRDQDSMQNLMTKRKKKVVLITSRMHPAETPSSFVCQGLIDFLIGSHPVAESLRRFVLFKIVPMLCGDGVFLGNCRTSVIGCDLNRVWTSPSELMNPEICMLKQIMTKIAHHYKEDVDLYLDLHASSTTVGSFVEGKKFDDVFRMEKHLLLPKLIGKISPDFHTENCTYANEPLRSGTPTRIVGSILGEKANCYTLFSSVHGFFDKSVFGQRIIPYTEERYMKLGENLALALAQSYVMTAHMPFSPDLGNMFRNSGASSSISSPTPATSALQVIRALDPSVRPMASGSSKK